MDFAVRLADEGVPLRAIARATQVSSDILRDQLAMAKEEGRLEVLPHDDWPPGFPRDQRALQLSRLVDENRDALFLTIQQIFHLTPTQAQLLLTMVQKNLPKDRYDMSPETIEVHICSIRKRLAPFNIAIQTLWGHGYQLSLTDRRRVHDMILASVVEAA